MHSGQALGDSMTYFVVLWYLWIRSCVNLVDVIESALMHCGLQYDLMVPNVVTKVGNKSKPDETQNISLKHV